MCGTASHLGVCKAPAMDGLKLEASLLHVRDLDNPICSCILTLSQRFALSHVIMASSPLYPPPEQQSYQTTPGPANPAIPPSPSSYGTTQPPPPPPKTHSDAHAPARATSTSSWDAGDQPYPPRRTSSRRPDSASWRGGGTVVADRARRYSRGGYYEGEEYAQSAGDAYRAEQPGRQSYAPQYPDERYEMGEDEGSGPYNRDGVQELGEPRPQDGLGDKLMFPPEGWVPEILPDKSYVTHSS